MPEKSLSEIPRPLREQYEKGVAAFQRENYDYAITFFQQVLEKEPAFFDCRQALRATQLKKVGASSGFFKKVWGGASASPLIARGEIALRRNPAEAASLAEQILSSDPNSSAGHRLLAKAALACDLPQTAVFSLEILVKNSPNDMEAAEQLAKVYLNLGQVNKAEELYNQLVAARPNDPNLAQAMKNLAAKRMLVEGGYEALADGTKTYRDILRDKDGAVSLEQENRQVKTEDVALRLIGEYEARLKAEPDNVKLMRSIADLHVQKKDFDRAIEYFRTILKVSGNSDPGVERAITDAITRKFDFATSQLDAQAPDYAEQKARIKAERDLFVIEECRRRVERYPNDLLVRFELGQYYFKAGKIGEAIQEFQKSQNNPNKRIASLNYLAQCFAQRNMNDLATRTFQNALKEKLVFDEEKKEMTYLLGCVLEKMGKKEEAIEQLKQVYEVDIGYKDVAAKVDAYYGSQG